MSLLATLGAVALARTVGQVIQKVSKQIFPFASSAEREKIDYNARLNQEQQERNRAFQVKLQELNFQKNKEITYMSAMLARQTSYLNAIQNAQNSLKSDMFRDVLRNYPLNIPPLVMLENAGIGTNSIVQTVLGTKINNDTEEKRAIENFKQELKANPIALSVFVTPLQVDSRVANKEKISAMVWDTVYQKVESMFVNEYSRNGERPVVFFPSAWNPNAKPGLHAAEIIYFFTKEMPVAVVEPRFDGKQLRIMFSCWSIGLESNKHIRQEITIDIDWNEIIMQAAYERSVQGLEELKKIEEPEQILLNIQKNLEHNKNMYESLKPMLDKNHFGNISDDCTKLFYTNSNDLSVISDTVSAALGMTLSVLSDIHHLLATQVTPIFPKIYNNYFKNMVNAISYEDKEEKTALKKSLLDIYNDAYEKILRETPALESDIKAEKNKVKSAFSKIDDFGIIDIINEPDNTQAKNKPEIQKTNAEDINDVIDTYCIENDITVHSFKEKLKAIKRIGNNSFIEKLIVLLEDDGYVFDAEF